MGKSNPFHDKNGLPRSGYEKSAATWEEAENRAASDRRLKKMFTPPTTNPFVDKSGKPRRGYEQSAASWKAPDPLDIVQEMSGYVYVLCNSAYSGLVKIGWTERTVEERLRELHTTGVPAPFKIAYALQHYSANKVEKMVHLKLESRRYRNNREFFRCTVKEAKATIDECAKRC